MTTHAHTHEGDVHEAEFIGELPPEFLHGFAETWFAIESRIKRENDLKAAMLSKVRAVHGPDAATALKLAMRLAGQEPNKRLKSDMHTKLANRFLRVIEGRDGPSRFDQ